MAGSSLAYSNGSLEMNCGPGRHRSWAAAHSKVGKISGTDSPEQLSIDTDSEFFNYTSHAAVANLAFLIADSNDQ